MNLRKRGVISMSAQKLTPPILNCILGHISACPIVMTSAGHGDDWGSGQ